MTGFTWLIKFLGDKLLCGHVPDPFPRCGIGSGHPRLAECMHGVGYEIMRVSASACQVSSWVVHYYPSLILILHSHVLEMTCSGSPHNFMHSSSTTIDLWSRCNCSCDYTVQWSEHHFLSLPLCPYLYCKVVWKEWPSGDDPGLCTIPVIVLQVRFASFHHPFTVLQVALASNRHPESLFPAVLQDAFVRL